MSYSREDALSSLAAVDSVERRVVTSQVYRRSAVFFFLWGVIWVLGYGASQTMPAHAALVWTLLDGAGLLIGSTISYRRRREGLRNGERAVPHVTSYAATFVAVVLFIVASYWVMRPTSRIQWNAYPALVVSFMYVQFGLWCGARFAIAGTVLGITTMVGVLLLPQYLPLWLALTGGGVLLLTGYWLWRN